MRAPPSPAIPELAPFVHLTKRQVELWVRRGYEEYAERLGGGAPPDAAAEWVTGGRAAHPIVALPNGERAVVREYLRGGMLRHLNRRRYFVGHRALDELRATERAAAAGVRTARVLAATQRREAFGYTASLATLWIPGARQVDAGLRGADAGARRRMWMDAGLQIARMHAAGIAHPDLNLRNLLVVDDEQVYLLDFDRAALHRGSAPHGRRARDLRRLARSARKLDVPVGRPDWTALREGYGAGWPLSEVP